MQLDQDAAGESFLLQLGVQFLLIMRIFFKKQPMFFFVDLFHRVVILFKDLFFVVKMFLCVFAQELQHLKYLFSVFPVLFRRGLFEKEDKAVDTVKEFAMLLINMCKSCGVLLLIPLQFHMIPFDRRSSFSDVSDEFSFSSNSTRLSR